MSKSELNSALYAEQESLSLEGGVINIHFVYSYNV